MLEGALFPGQGPEGSTSGSQPQGPLAQNTTQPYVVAKAKSRIFNKKKYKWPINIWENVFNFINYETENHNKYTLSFCLLNRPKKL